VFQARIQDFFHPIKLGSPEIAHVVEALADGADLAFISATTSPTKAALNSIGMPIAK